MKVKRVITEAELDDGTPVLIAMSHNVILVAYHGKAALVHRQHRWFDKTVAREMVKALEAFVDGEDKTSLG